MRLSRGHPHRHLGGVQIITILENVIHKQGTWNRKQNQTYIGVI